MKFLKILRQYLKGIRLYILVLSLMMTWAILAGIVAAGRLDNIRTDIRALSGADEEKLYVLSNFSSINAVKLGDDRNLAINTEALLEAEDAVEQVFHIQVVNPVIYEDTTISMVVFEPGLLEAFPGLRSLGIDFEDCPNGCILGSKMFNALNTGDTVTLNFSKQAFSPRYASFQVAGHLDTPYRRPSLSVSATHMYAADLFEDGDTILVQGTDEVLEKLRKSARRMEYDRNLIVQFKADVPEVERQALLARLAPEYYCTPLRQVVENSQASINEKLKQELPLPLFLAFTAMVAYLSVVVLVFQRKQRDLAILGLCGCSLRKRTVLAFCTFQMFSLIPVLISILVVVFLRDFQWDVFDMKLFGLYPEWYSRVMQDPASANRIHMLGDALDSITVGPTQLLIIAGYYVLTCGICMVAAMGIARKQTPVVYLKGVSE